MIVGGAIMGCSAAWWLTEMPDFDGSILVVERDGSYAQASTTLTNSCIRQQFSSEINIRISQFTAEFIGSLKARMDGRDWAPDLKVHNFGYLYLAADERFAASLRAAQKMQAAAGAGTRLMSPDDIAAAFPFYDLDGIVLGSFNDKDEGYWDGSTVFECWRRSARERGVEFVSGEVVAMTRDASGTRVESVALATGETIGCGQVVNASGPRAARTAAMAGLDLPVEPRKRFAAGQRDAVHTSTA
ncbi:MAG: FAD-dependent oxidoreductase [Pseudomonadota bacterium]